MLSGTPPSSARHANGLALSSRVRSVTVAKRAVISKSSASAGSSARVARPRARGVGRPREDAPRRVSPTRAPSRRPLARDDAIARADALADIALDAFRGGRARVVVVATRVEVCLGVLVTRRLASIHIHAALGWESVRPVDVVGLGAAVGRARVGRSRGRRPARRLRRGECVRSLLRPRAFALQVFVPGVYAALRVLLVTRFATRRRG